MADFVADLTYCQECGIAGGLHGHFCSRHDSATCPTCVDSPVFAAMMRERERIARLGR